jgi:branched-chain amino acid aminotransferase
VIIWMDGALMPLEDARISPLDHGLTVGDGVFETMRVYDAAPFAWRRHLERLAVSAAGLGLELPDVTALRDAATDVIAANGLRDARLRLTVTSGPAPPGSSRRAGGRPVAFMVATPIEAAAPTVDVVVAPWTRNEHGAAAGLKTISYAANVRALAYAEERGAGEAIFANTRGDLCEATGSNVFVVRDGTLVTPPASAGCLLGVTRGLLLELAENCKEADIPVEALANADEAFLSSTTREVQPIAHVDGVALPTAPGPVSIALATAFRALVARDIDP